MSYISDIEKYQNLTLDDIIAVSRNNVSGENRNTPCWCPGLNHGTAVLQSAEQLCCYLAAYGEMHKQKIDKALEHFPFKNLDSDIEIIDWGSGQGIASVHFISYLRNANLLPKLRKVTLIEPSEVALERAEFNVSKAVGESVEIECVRKYLPSFIDKEDSVQTLHIEEPICVHLFSNILDIFEIDLKKLANLIGSSGYQHYFVCVGPVNYGNQRIEAFCRYFSIEGNNLFANDFIPQYKQLPNGKWFGCVAKGFKMLRQEGKPFLVPLSFYPPKEFLAAYQIDAVRSAGIDVSANVAFDVLAPFDFGASIYTNVDPILAVINNIITRGIPTKCSPFIEEKFSKILKATVLKEKYGGITYEVSDSTLINKYESYLKFIPIGIATLLRKVENIADQLKGYTEKLVFSFADIEGYKKVKANLDKNGVQYLEWEENSMLEFAERLSALNKTKGWNYVLATCGEKVNLEQFGIVHNHCVDDELIIRCAWHDAKLMDYLNVEIGQVQPTLFEPAMLPPGAIELSGNHYAIKRKDNKDKGQRQFCGCIVSKDIGQYNTCAHLCEYCYANTSKETAVANWKRHKENPFGEKILG